MTVSGCDFSTPDVPNEVLTKNRVAFAARYVSATGNPKNLTLAEAHARAASGIKSVTCMETTADRALGGFNAGRIDVQVAEAQAQALDQPIGYPIYYAVDFSPLAGQTAVVLEYFQGLRSLQKRYKVGVYGSLAVCQAVDKANLAEYIWQTYAWSGGKWYSKTHIRQYRNGVNWNGYQVDLDEALTEDYGGWWPGGFAPPGAVTPPVTTTPPSRTDWMTTIMDRLPNLQQGARDPIGGQWFVRRVQALLQDVASIKVGPIDGDFGPDTELAVKAFQRARHLTADGIVGPHTWAYLITGGDV